jgi:hypothetical protein
VERHPLDRTREDLSPLILMLPVHVSAGIFVRRSSATMVLTVS